MQFTYKFSFLVSIFTFNYCKSTYYLNLCCNKSIGGWLHFLGSVQSATCADFVANFCNNFSQPVTTRIVAWRVWLVGNFPPRFCRFHVATTGFPAEWRLRNECRNSILMTRHFSDLSRPSDWFSREGNLLQAIKSTSQIWVVTCHQYKISSLVS